MAFRELKGTGGGNFFKWDKVGGKFVGQFKALATGDYNGKVTFHAVFIDPQGKSVKVNTPTILRDKLTEAEAGMNLEIEYTENLAGKNGRTGAKNFKVSVLGDIVPDAPSQPKAAPAPAEDPVEAMKRMLLAQQAAKQEAVIETEYQRLIAKLTTKDEKGAPSLITALEQIYKSEEERTKALRDHLKAQGVAV